MTQRVPAVSRRDTLRIMVRQRQLYWMILPAMVAVAVFTYAPLFGWWMAFSDYKLGKPIFDAQWVGLKYFIEFFTDSAGAGQVIVNTVVMNVASLLLGLVCALIFAVFLKEVRWPKFRRFVQSASFFPYFMSWVIIYAVIYALFSSDGAVNASLQSIGLIDKPLNILGNAKTSWGLIITVNVWNILGYNSVMFIAAIAGIPEEQYEAARIDGATRYHEMLHVTLPNLIPTLIVLLILGSGSIFNSYLDQFFIFTNTLNISTMEVFDYYIYRFGLKQGNFSYATAVGIVKTLVSLVLLIGVNWLSRKTTDQALF
jgi:putative aldouronate transport system permease protein